MTLDAALQNDIVLTYLLIVACALGIAGLALGILTAMGKKCLDGGFCNWW